MKWTPEQMNRLERAITDGGRVQITRRGTEYVVQPRSLRSEGATEILSAVHPTTGDELEFRLDEVSDFAAIGV